MDIDALIQLDKQLLLTVNGSESLFFDGLIKILTTATTWIPLYVSLFYLVLKNNDSLQKILLVVASAGLCIFLAGSLDDMIVKPLVARWRPTHDPQIGELVDVVNGYRGGDYGFFSAHASNTFSIAFFFCWLVRSPLLSMALVVWSFVNCYTRMYLGVHYPGDILVGVLWGATVGGMVYMVYRRIYRRLSTGTSYVSSKYTSTGYQQREIDIVVSVLVYTLIYACLRACMFQ